MGRSEKNGYKIFPDSEYSMEDAERFFQIYSRKHREYFMSVQAVAYFPGKCDLVKGLYWPEGDDSQFLTSKQSRNNSSETGEANEQESVSCRLIQRWRRKMFWNFEWDVVLKIQVIHRKTPDVTHLLGLFYTEVCSGGGYGDLWAERSRETWVGVGDAFWEPARAWQKRDSWFLQREMKGKTLEFMLFTSPSDGWWNVAALGMGRFARQPVNPWIQFLPPYQSWHRLHHSWRSNLMHSDASSQVAKEHCWVVTKPDQP